MRPLAGVLAVVAALAIPLLWAWNGVDFFFLVDGAREERALRNNGPVAHYVAGALIFVLPGLIVSYLILRYAAGAIAGLAGECVDEWRAWKIRRRQRPPTPEQIEFDRLRDEALRELDRLETKP